MFSHVNMGFFSQHGILKKSHVNMEHLFLMKLATLQWNVQLSLSAHAATKLVSSRCWRWSCCRQSTSALCVRSWRHWHSSPPICACQQLLLARLEAGKHVACSSDLPLAVTRSLLEPRPVRCLVTTGGNLTCGPRGLVDGLVVDTGLGLALATTWSHGGGGRCTANPPTPGGFRHTSPFK